MPSPVPTGGTQRYMEYLLKEWRLKTIVAERKPRSPGELAFAAVVFIAMM